MRMGPFRTILFVLCACVFRGGIPGTSQTGMNPNGSPPSATVSSGVATAAQVEPSDVRPATPDYAGDPKFLEALASAKEKKAMPPEERLGRWKKASKIAKGKCVECLHQMMMWQMQLSKWEDVDDTASKLDAIATTPAEKFYAESQRGIALMHTNDDEPSSVEVKEAEASIRSALAIAPRSAALIFLEGRALAMMGRDDEAKEMFQKYVDLVKATDTYRERAAHFIEDPTLAALRMAPAFTLTTSEGEQMSLDDMGGKVVLLDFWATWCGPCKESLPEIQRIAKKFADEPFVVISISSDQNESAWKNFIRMNHMTWPQYRDANGALSRAYSVSAIPHYFSIDTYGVLQSVKMGSGADVEGDVRKLVKKALDAEKKKAKESERAQAGG
jgi:thiol-disulfide isomerase/thioredoxin